jgi:hypothetical protein
MAELPPKVNERVCCAGQLDPVAPEVVIACAGGYNRANLWGGPDWGLRCRPAPMYQALTGEPVEPDPVSTGVGSRA